MLSDRGGAGKGIDWLSSENNHIEHCYLVLFRALLQPNILRESRYRTHYGYEIVPDQLVRANIHTTLMIPKGNLIEEFRKNDEPLKTLDDLLSWFKVPIVLLSQPKSQMLIAEDLKVDGEEVSRLNRFEASYYTTLWFLRKLHETDEKMYSAFAPCVGDVLGALIAYSPKNIYGELM